MCILYHTVSHSILMPRIYVTEPFLTRLYNQMLFYIVSRNHAVYQGYTLAISTKVSTNFGKSKSKKLNGCKHGNHRQLAEIDRG